LEDESKLQYRPVKSPKNLPIPLELPPVMEESLEISEINEEDETTISQTTRYIKM